MINNIFKLRAINLHEIKLLCKKIKNKPDFKKVTIKITLENWDIIGKILLKILNTSINNGIFPNNWKNSMVHFSQNWICFANYFTITAD